MPVRDGDPTPARAVALNALLEIERNASSDSGKVLDKLISEAGLDSRDARLATALMYAVLRNKDLLDAQFSVFLTRPASTLSFGSKCLLRMAAAQRFFLGRVPAHAMSNESVQLARKTLKMPGRNVAFVNAMVRKISAMTEPVRPAQADAVARLGSLFSHPLWLVDMFRRKFGGEAFEQVLAANNREPAAALRVNRLLVGIDDLRSRLEEAGVDAQPSRLSPDALVLQDAGQLRELLHGPLFIEGLFYVQDEASQIVAHVAAPQPGMRVLDLCAAPGGKCIHMAELAGGKAQVVATDISPERLGLVVENAGRMRTTGLVVKSFGEVAGGRELYDLVLVDGPCSGLGTIRRNPEIKYRVTPDALRSMQARQADLLEKAAHLVAPTGRLVYSTCSVSDDENIGVVKRFLARQPSFGVEDSPSALPQVQAMRGPDGLYRSWPAFLETDGFEIAVLRRLK